MGRLIDTKAAFAALCLFVSRETFAGSSTLGSQVAVLYNLNVAPDSRLAAEYYAEKRGVPRDNLIGLPMPRSETITRAEFRTQILEPLLKQLESRNLMRFHAEIVPATAGRPGLVLWLPVASEIRYLVLSYGVPLRISHDDSVVPPMATNLPPQQRRTEAAVDSELALLPRAKNPLRVHGPYGNPFFGTTNAFLLHPTNGVLIVSRLDGPSVRVARELVDKAIEAERHGLWGYAYFDLRGLGDSPYRRGDDWLRKAAEVAAEQGFAPVIDENACTFPVHFPMPHIALYAGWYDNSPSGPFMRTEVEFMPGAFAYHLYSYSATTLRTASSWGATLLEKGATATVGYVYEPYLDATIDVGVFMSRWLGDGWTFGEAAAAAQPALSWQTTVVGDPLYRPRSHTVQQYRDELVASNSPLLQWAELRLSNLAEVGGTPRKALIEHLTKMPILQKSPVLEARLAELYAAEGNYLQSTKALERALKLKPSPQMRRHLQLSLARRLAFLDRYSDALRYYEELAATETEKAARLALFEEALPVARNAGASGTAARLEREIAALKQILTKQNPKTQ
ncbi:MAG: TIGR03790 family protein [Verrucomicrobiae bacterium]|nr:TIGR03790 family protein [Verrucomicrobiae bacterium]